MTAIKNLDFLKSFSYGSILRLTWTLAGSKTVLYSPQFTRQYPFEKAFIYCHFVNPSIPYVKPFVNVIRKGNILSSPFLFSKLSTTNNLLNGYLTDKQMPFGTISSTKTVLKNMKINGKISSYTNLIDFVNSGEKV